MLELLMNTRPFTSPTSMSRVLPPSAMRTAARASSGTPISRAKWFSVPTGSTASGMGVPTSAEATALTVPSPPAATTSGGFSRTSSCARSFGLPSARRMSACPPASLKSRSMSFAERLEPERGLTMTGTGGMPAGRQRTSLVFGSAGPAVGGDVERDAVRVVVLHFVEAAALGRLAHPVLAAGRFDRLAGAGHVVDDEAEVMHADEGAALLAGVFLLPVVEEGEVHHAIGEVHAVRAVPVGAADALQAERLLVELRRLLGIGDGNRDMS